MFAASVRTTAAIIMTTSTGTHTIIDRGTGKAMSQAKVGMFYGVGAGPGDPELMTRKAERILKAVDWIFLPAGGRSGSSFVRRIVEPLGLPAEKFRPVSLCMSRDRTDDVNAYVRAAREIVDELRRGKSAAWLTEGDPLFYSTFLHVSEALKRYPEVRIEIVPGVTSAGAAAARVGLPVARLDDRVAFVPAFYGVKRLAALLDDFATVFLLKVNSVFDQLLAELASVRGPVRAVYLECVGTPEERVVTDLESLRGQELSYFSLLILRREGQQ
jgi:precorrin-2/cobalt-factor-2 C20-methyltransferase